MDKFHRREGLVLLFGDIVVLGGSLWITLALRYLELPSLNLIRIHFPPFLFLFLASLVVFYIAGLYDIQRGPFRAKTAALLLKAQIANAAIAALFFYVVPNLGIAPKTNLFMYLGVSLVLVSAWRFASTGVLAVGRKEPALLIGEGEVMKALLEVVNTSKSYTLHFGAVLDLSTLPAENLQERIAAELARLNTRVIVADLDHPKVRAVLSSLYSFLVDGVAVIDAHTLYEEIFERVPLTGLSYTWFLEHIAFERMSPYDFLKRAMDIVLAVPVGIIFLITFPFIWVAQKIEDGGPAFSIQDRIGQGMKPIKIYKLRTMNRETRGGWVGKGDSRVTKVGSFLRKSRLDEFAQFWNVLRGDISFIGPRPDVIGNYEELVKELPYYSMRYAVKPGLSGWAQVKQELPPQSLEETRLRLSFDFFYIKNRSLFLDIRIALKTIKTLLSRLGI